SGRSFSVVKTSYTRSAGEAKGSVRYMQHRQDDLGERQARLLFDQDGELSRQEVYERLDRAAESDGKTYFYRLTFNPGEGHADLDEQGRQAWAAEQIARIEAQGNTVKTWVGVSHTDQGQHDHVHVLAATSRTLQKDELADLRTFGRETYEYQREQQRELGLYQDHAGGTQELAQFHQHERSYEQDQDYQRQQQRDRSYGYEY
ncbi:hypothetical protein, partial [Deinococcus frigens]